MRERGVLTRGLADGSVQISPAFVITRDELGVIASAIDEALTEAGSVRAPRPRQRAAGCSPDVTSDEAGGFGSLDERLLADVPPHHGG